MSVIGFCIASSCRIFSVVLPGQDVFGTPTVGTTRVEFDRHLTRTAMTANPAARWGSTGTGTGTGGLVAGWGSTRHG